MPAIRKGLVVDSGTTWRLSIRYRDFERNPVDLTGHTVTLRLFTPGRDTTVLHTATADVTADGWIHFRIADEVTDLWAVGKYAYSVEMETPNGDKDRLFYGPLEVRSEANV